MPHLKQAEEHPFDLVFRSHSHKALRVHTNGVLAGVERHTLSPVARVATLFHDLGKLNPNFQPKLDGVDVKGYSNHSYLSAATFLAFWRANPKISELDLEGSTDVIAVLTLIAHHHGRLPHLREIFSNSEREKLFEFLTHTPNIPFSEFLEQWLPHKTFNVYDLQLPQLWDTLNGKAGDTACAVKNPLQYWMDTQFSFASLIESDKRDAGDNKRFRRAEQLNWAECNFGSALNNRLDKLKENIPDELKELNRVRTELRTDAVASLLENLEKGSRVFTLTAPTGAGKTFTLLELAAVIREGRHHLSVVYGLPFLSITEQVEGICHTIWPDTEDQQFVTRIDSRAQNPQLDKLLQEAENDTEAALSLVKEHFSSETFDGAFIITTFVQIFETLLSNRNATLLKLPNFAKTIFLLDEIQALPPRLYIFFTAYLQCWCEKFDCYAILSTATMPHLEMTTTLPDSHDHHPHRLFPDYKPPNELLSNYKFFDKKVFDRYHIVSHGNRTHSQLADDLEIANESCLVILNTIDDTKKLYEELSSNRLFPDTEIVLLNTHFTLEDRRKKIDACKQYLEAKQRVILVSTQLIEAGVDIDFPMVFRDSCLLPNLIQSAGRCNRNGKLERGTVVFFTLIDENCQPRANCIYRHPTDQCLLEQTSAALAKPHDEKELLNVQRVFFERMAHNFAIGDHPLRSKEGRITNSNLIEYIADFNYPVVGTFRLIDEREFGEEYRLYVPESDADKRWDELSNLIVKIAQAHERNVSASEMRVLNIKLDGQLRTMSGRIVTVRCKAEALPPLVSKRGGNWELCGLLCLLMPHIDYSLEEGLKLHGQGTALL